MDKGGTMIERVRAVLVTPDNCLLAIRRDRPDRATYWVLPGGHVDPEDQNIEAALSREISEEIAGEARAAICSRYRTCDPPRPASTSRDLKASALVPRCPFGKGGIYPERTVVRRGRHRLRHHERRHHRRALKTRAGHR